MVLVGCGNSLLYYGPAHHLNQLTQFGYLSLADTLVHGIAFDKILFQNAVCPSSKLYTSPALYAVANGYNYIEIIVFYIAAYES